MVMFPAGKERIRALGIWGAAGMGGAAGSILGGVLTEWFGWQAVLWVNVPIGLAALALAPRLLPAAAEVVGVPVLLPNRAAALLWPSPWTRGSPATSGSS
jgi:MFS family permease